MSIRTYLTQTLGATQLFMLDDALIDTGSNGISTTFNPEGGAFEPTKICEGTLNSYRSSDVEFTHGQIVNTIDINDFGGGNTAPYTQRTIHLWFKSDAFSGPTCVYEQGGSTNNFALNLGIAKAITFQAADAGEPFLLAQSNFLADADRPYFVTAIWEHHSAHAGSGNRVSLHINGVFQETVELDGTALFPAHSGDVAIGNTNENLRSYNGSTQAFTPIQKNLNMIGFYNNKSFTENESREVFERSVVPLITINADTVANQQFALDALSGNSYDSTNCAIRIIQATDATDYRLFVDNIQFAHDPNLRDIAIQYVGPNTLTLENTNGSNTAEISTPAEIDMDGTTILPGGGNIMLQQDTIRLPNVADQTNIIANKIVITQPGTYNFTNVLINELENMSGGTVTITSDQAIPSVLDSNGTTILIDSFLSFEGIDSWTLYNNATDRDNNANIITSGTGSNTYPFTYTGSEEFFLRVISSGITFFLESIPNNAGETQISLNEAALLTALTSDVQETKKLARLGVQLSA